MAKPIAVPQHQSRAFDRALAKRLGLNGEEIGTDLRIDIDAGGDEYARLSVSFTAYLPEAEVREMFNNAGKVSA